MKNVDFNIYQKQLKFVTMQLILTDQSFKFMKFLSGMYNFRVMKIKIDFKYYKSDNVVSTYSMPNKEWMTVKYIIIWGVRILLELFLYL